MRPAFCSRLASLRGLGFGLGRLIALVTCIAIGAAGGVMLLGASPGLASSAAAVAVLATLATTHHFANVLAREVDSPLQRATALLSELHTEGTAGRLPELGAPQVLQLLRTINAASHAAVQRDRSCADRSQAAASAIANAQNVLQQLAVAVLELDSRGRILAANPTACTWFNLPPQDPGDRRPRDLLHGQIGAVFASTMQEATSGRQPWARRNGIRVGARDLDLHIALGEGRHATGNLIALCTDVTHLHEAGRERELLLHTLSGELRSRLQHVCSNTQILASLPQDRPAEWREFAAVLLDEGRRLGSLIEDAAHIEAVRAGECEWHMAQHDLANLIADAIRLAEQRFDQAGMHFELRIDGPTQVHCDGPRLADVLVRLLHAACDHGRPGEMVQVTVQGNPERVEVVIAQDRPGLRMHAIRESEPPGYGMTLCRSTTEAMGGSLHHEDSPYGGNQYRIVLPQLTPAQR